MRVGGGQELARFEFGGDIANALSQQPLPEHLKTSFPNRIRRARALDHVHVSPILQIVSRPAPANSPRSAARQASAMLAGWRSQAMLHRGASLPATSPLWGASTFSSEIVARTNGEGHTGLAALGGKSGLPPPTFHQTTTLASL